jgi:aminoglycoside phosphotransferase (APT) family kinase protein
METGIRLSELQRLAAGREAEVFAIDAGRVLRLAMSSSQSGDVEREALVLVAANDAGAPVPAVLERVTVDGRPGLIVERLDGDDLLARLGRQPWRVWSVARTLGRLHARMHRVRAPRDLPTFREQLGAQIRSPLIPADLRAPALRRLEALPDGDQLCHCDFHPANLLRAGHDYAVIDWCHATRGDPAGDVARSRLLLTAAALPEDTPAVMRALTQVGRRIMLSGYMAAYRRHAEVAPRDVAMWAPVLATARLAEDIEEERPTMLALARANI